MTVRLTCCYLFGHKDLEESHLKQRFTPHARKVRDTEGGRNMQGGLTADLFSSFEKLMNL